MRVLAPFFAALLLAACSESSTTTKEPEKPAEPITGRQAFQSTYPSARMWAPDCQPLRIRSFSMEEVKSEGGKAGAWEIMYVSASKSAGKVYTWSAVDRGDTWHKGVFGGQEQTWHQSTQETPFDATALKVDTPAALETAIASGKAYVDAPGAKPPVNFVLEFTPRFPEPVWRVLWGSSPGTAEYTVFVDASSGKLLGKG